jgi:multidrug efflux pump subunit AcrA (membrane-fusion protein)
MAEFLARRVFAARRLVTRRAVVIAAVVVVAGMAAGGAALVAGGGHGSAASSAGGGSVPTATVVRTDLVSTVQDGGSIGYGGSYTVAAPSGSSASQVSQEQQAVAEDQQALLSDEQAQADASASGSQQVAAGQANVRSDQSTLSSDQAEQAKDCAGAGASSPACSQDTQSVRSDQAALTQAQQQLASAQANAKQQDDQDQAKVGSDQVKLQGDQASLASGQASAVNPGTTYTWLPQPGQVIKQDQPVYAVSNQPVPLLYGSIPAYRAFEVGMPDGGDVGELTHDLIALGDGAGLAQSNHYSSATAAAVTRWQSALGLPATGEVLLGEVVFEPGPIRVTSVTPSVGTAVGGGGGGAAGGGGAGGGTVLTATGTTPLVTVDLAVTQEYLVKPGDVVSVVLPDGTTTVNGQVETVGNVATCPGSGGVGSGSGASTAGGSADQSPCSSGGSGGGGGSDSSATVTVTISLDSTPAEATLDQAPVNVNITEQRADDVLAVPVNALLALAGGGYAVQVVTGSGASHLVAVTTGLYSNSMVAVSGPGIAAGTRVEVPSS